MVIEDENNKVENKDLEESIEQKDIINDSDNQLQDESEDVLEEREFSSRALSDFKLIDQATSGDEKAYAELMRRYRKPVQHTLMKMVRNADDAEDLMIEAFAKAFKNLPKFKKDYTFSTWLFRIATNNCIDFIRKKKLETMSINTSYTDDSGEPVDLDIRDENLNPQESAISKQKIELVRNFVGLLPEKYQRLVEMRYFDELSYEEIAEHLQAPLGTVKAQLHRARELLYDLVKEKRDVI
ncbi:RNA polymerase sigma factor [Thermoflexibacter ruber]|uniref:RNA polymerase sigma-70 factor, ECF subfamily n=1 Tax=Thermoflexibacter ruber TaxID=1003 RepID=A0A1I2HA44_9BACT|nr:sigma-70 family RNA polymerase sigma factor [Thermoflexibacter ruber]SFF25616.1 RNA polymerase sigma-70 factor, ECF subfamily [Thermoflexibacter ruber]